MGIFGKPLKRAIWNTLGLHAVLTTQLPNAVCAECAYQACTIATISLKSFLVRFLRFLLHVSSVACQSMVSVSCSGGKMVFAPSL